MSKKTKHSGFTINLVRNCNCHTHKEFIQLRNDGNIKQDENGDYIVPQKEVAVEAEVTTLHLRNHEMRIVWTNPFTNETNTDNISSDKFFQKYQITC